MLSLIFFITISLTTVHHIQSLDHTRQYYEGKSKAESLCYEWDIKCDPFRHELVCCRWAEFNTTEIEHITVCQDGWLSDSIGNCNIEACSPNCTENEYCSSNGNCTSNDCYPGYLDQGQSCVCPEGFLATGQHTCTVNTRYPSPLLHFVNFNVVTEDNMTGAVTFRNRAFKRQQNLWTNSDLYNRITIAFDYYISWKNVPINGIKPNINKGSELTATLATPNCDPAAFFCTSLSADNNYGSCHATFGSRCSPPPNNSRYVINVQSRVLGSTYDIYRGYLGFDTTKPQCSNSNYNFVSPELLNTSSEFTVQKGIWSDTPSGIWQYHVMVYQLSLGENNALHQATLPLMTQTMYSSSTSVNLSKTGVYSFILGVVDYAGNAEFVRRFVIFDPSSDVSVTEVPMYAASATRESNYTWQNYKRFLTVVWKDHFQNLAYKNGGLLNDIDPSPFHGSNFTLTPRLDDMEGKRQLTGIRNWNGIVKFEYLYNAGKSYKQSDQWKELVGEKMTINKPISEKDDVCTVWVRGFDIMNRVIESHVTIQFDTTLPEWDLIDGNTITWEKNIPDDSQFLFQTRVNIKAFDLDSGISMVRWYILDSDNANIVYGSGSVLGPISAGNCLQISDRCYKARDDQFYLKDLSFFINHCSINYNGSMNPIVLLRLEVYNPAMLVVIKHKEIGQLQSFKGINVYNPVFNVKSTFISQQAVTLAWEYPVGCFSWTQLYISTGIADLDNKIEPVIPANRSWLDLTNLQPNHEYSVTFSLQYSDRNATKVFMFTTKEEDKNYKIALAVVAGVFVGTIVLVIVVMVLIRTCKKRKLKSKSEFEMDVVISKNSESKQTSLQKIDHDNKQETNDYEEDDDNLYEKLPGSEQNYYKGNNFNNQNDHNNEAYEPEEVYSNEHIENYSDEEFDKHN